MIDRSGIRKHWRRALAFNAVSFSGFGEYSLGSGVKQLIHTRGTVEWINSLLMGSAFLLYGIYWAVMLLRRVTQSEAVNPSPD